MPRDSKYDDCVITEARIIPRQGGLFGDCPKVMVKVDECSKEFELFDYFEDEISFSTPEFVGKTVSDGVHLKFEKDRRYLQS